MTLEQRINDTWKGIGRLGKFHFVFNTYNMAIRECWFELIALYDGYNDVFLVVSDLYNINFVKSSREALITLFTVFANDAKGNPEFTNIYQALRKGINSTTELGLDRDCKIKYIHSSNMQKGLSELIEVNKTKIEWVIS